MAFQEVYPNTEALQGNQNVLNIFMKQLVEVF